MRLIALAIILTAGSAAADPKPLALSVADVTAQLQPVANDIEHCYLDRAAEIRGAGKLDIVLTITRKGAIESLAVKTPGLPVKLAKQIDGCVRLLVEPVAFPARKTFTTATIPFFFQHTAAPGSGPQESCWDAAGCPTSSKAS
jgi:hypothetical protein